MPVYEYRCKNCGHDFEVTQSMSDDALTECPACNEPQLRKVFQPVGIAFKGSGFYKNDSRPAPPSTAHEGSSSQGSSSQGSSSAASSSGSDSSAPGAVTGSAG